MIHISKMTGKLEGFKAISTNTTTNDYCIKQYEKKDPKNICTFCYSQEMLRTYRKNMANAIQRNSDIIASKVLHSDGLPIILDAFFRFNAHGELINEINLINYVNIASVSTFWNLENVRLVSNYSTYNNIIASLEIVRTYALR